MPNPLLGVRLPNSGPLASPAAIRDTAKLAERMGFDTVWLHDHINWPPERLKHFAVGCTEICQGQDPDFYESLTTAAVIAGAAPGINVGIGGLVLPLRNPLVLAKQLATIDRLSGARLRVGLAIGNVESDFTTLGIPYKRRGRITNEYLDVLRTVFAAGGSVGYEGEFLAFSEGTFLPRPSGLELWIAAASEVGVERIARYGDGWLNAYLPPPAFAEFCLKIDRAVASAGRDPATVTKAYESFACIDERPGEAERLARASLKSFFGDAARGMASCLIGTPAQVEARIQEYASAGAEYVDLKFICRDISQMHDMMHMVDPKYLP